MNETEIVQQIERSIMEISDQFIIEEDIILTCPPKNCTSYNVRLEVTIAYFVTLLNKMMFHAACP